MNHCREALHAKHLELVKMTRDLFQVRVSLVCTVTDLQAVVETLGFRLHLLGVFQHPLVQNQRLTPLLHQHVGLGDEEAPEREPGREGGARQHNPHANRLKSDFFFIVGELDQFVSMIVNL